MSKRLMMSVTVAAVMALAVAFTGVATAAVFPEKPGQMPQHGPPLTSGGRGAQVTHCNAEPGNEGNVVYNVQQGKVLHNNCGPPA